MNEIGGMIFIVVGLVSNFLGCLGLIRLPDVYNRLQASTKCVTLGTCGILFGVFLLTGLTPEGIKALLCIIFIILTAPVSIHALSRGAHRSGIRLWEKSVCDKYQEDKKLIS